MKGGDREIQRLMSSSDKDIKNNFVIPSFTKLKLWLVIKYKQARFWFSAKPSNCPPTLAEKTIDILFLRLCPTFLITDNVWIRTLIIQNFAWLSDLYFYFLWAICAWSLILILTPSRWWKFTNVIDVAWATCKWWKRATWTSLSWSF